MDSKVEEITLYNLVGGALDAQFLEALENVARNIDDPNTEPTAKRKLVVTLTFTPSEQRTSAQLHCEVVTKLPGRVPLQSTAFFGYDKVTGRYVAREFNPRQMTLSEPSQREALESSGPPKKEN